MYLHLFTLVYGSVCEWLQARRQTHPYYVEVHIVSDYAQVYVHIYILVVVAFWYMNSYLHCWKSANENTTVHIEQCG